MSSADVLDEALTNSCATYTGQGLEAIDLPTGSSSNATIKFRIMGIPAQRTYKVTTPVQLYNAVAGSGDSRVSVVQPLAGHLQDPNMPAMETNK